MLSAKVESRHIMKDRKINTPAEIEAKVKSLFENTNFVKKCSIKKTNTQDGDLADLEAILEFKNGKNRRFFIKILLVGQYIGRPSPLTPGVWPWPRNKNNI